MTDELAEILWGAMSFFHSVVGGGEHLKPKNNLVALHLFTFHKKTPKMTIASKEIINSVYWDNESIILIEYVAQWETINPDSLILKKF